MLPLDIFFFVYNPVEDTSNDPVGKVVKITNLQGDHGSRLSVEAIQSMKQLQMEEEQ